MNSFIRSIPALLAAFAAAYGASVTFDLSKPAAPVEPRLMSGTCLPIWNSSKAYQEMHKGLKASRYRLFRFPNGTLSNEYHWNGSGSYSPEGVWTCDSAAYKPGFLSYTRYRGTTNSGCGAAGASRITDGDTSTCWQSDEYITQSAPYFYVELSIAQPIDSVVIVWGEKYAADFDIDFYSLYGSFYPGPYKYSDNCWLTRKSVTDNTQPVHASAIQSSDVARYLRVIVKKFAAGAGSVQVKEFYCYYKGKQLTVNVKQGGTKVVAMPTHVGNDARPETASWVTWHFESFMDYIRTLGDSTVPVMCVNYGTGTPDEAAAWVRYANTVKKYGITFWQVGNEMDGDWEQGGPVSAKIYAEKFILFAKAMKQADPAIKILGPLLSNAEFMAKNSGEFDGMSWMQSFMKYVGDKEKADSTKYCDGVDFHSYPYWSDAPAAAAMMKKVDLVYDQSDSLKKWIPAYLADPDSVFVMLSEYNASVVMSDLLQKPINGVFVANMFAGHAEKFGNRAMSVFWDSFEGGGVGPNNSFGSLSLFNTPPGTMYTSFTKAPSSAYWGLYTLTTLWIDPAAANNAPVPAVYNRKDGIRAYGLKGANDFRALLVNVSFDTVSVACTLSGGSYSQADVFSWGGKQFAWNGTDKNSYAFPNCGPVSKSIAIASLGEIKVAPLSLCVVRYREGNGAAAPASLVHACALNANLLTGKPLVFCGSASGNGRVTKIEYSFDDSSKFADTVHALDGAFDGPFESFVDSVSAASLKTGYHILYLRVSDTGSATALDSIIFRVSGEPRPVALIDDFQDGDLAPVIACATPWKGAAGGNNDTKITPSVKTGGPGDAFCSAEFTIVQPDTPSWPNYVTVSTRLDSSAMVANAGWFSGITFSYSTKHTGSAGQFFLHIHSSKVTDFCHFNVYLPGTYSAWKTMSLTWDQLRQYDWGVQVGRLETRDIRGIEFRAQSAGSGYLAIDNVAFLGDTGKAINLPVRPGSAEQPRHVFSVKALRKSGALYLAVSAPDAAPFTASLYTINGKLLAAIPGTIRDGKSLLRLSGSGNVKQPIARGLYVIVIESRRRAEYRAPLVIAW